MLRFFYTLLFYLFSPILLLMMWRKARQIPKCCQSVMQRYGIYHQHSQPKADGIVIHAASVGEVIAATPMVKAIQARYPDLPITVTTMTATGSARVQANFGSTVSHFYLPFDLPDSIKRFLRFVRPRLLLVVETELWPNLITQLHQHNIPFGIVNARLSARSVRRYRWVAKHLPTLVESIDFVLAQDSVSAERYAQIGVPSEKLLTVGNLKFDLSITPELYRQAKQTAELLNIANRQIWIAGSTHEGEEKILLAAHQTLLEKYPNLLLILVPRHPERFVSVEHLLKQMAITYQKRSENSVILPESNVLLGDTMGEMLLLYGLSQIAFVGGSLVEIGGHNPLEPLAFNLPVISGKHTFNFPEIFTKLREVNGVIEVESRSEELVLAVNRCLAEPEFVKQLSQKGMTVLAENKGSVQRHLNFLDAYLAMAIE
ncbi:3-deoxy-D-manno-octulosonic-acid transferase [Nicoletella semolina]|uniref:3-deoxy-D-manno-octulosonic acid transferase n=1 Tax=Nicoletella semolina TaxID=271160 RepID=A0A4R2NCS7_9PAST|nr:lipid IV(A) 3-deoxy-D-manno-octulosonic acid transferase [Nicoletella semolina]MDH2924228.1 3-deoxy-D-manno-octulosonic acid transferase [Nicoletella semolina]TCP18874.1 3-deoxy-D-manno-octulosonic-acid transferase [Nicoletella semolina]